MDLMILREISSLPMRVTLRTGYQYSRLAPPPQEVMYQLSNGPGIQPDLYVSGIGQPFPSHAGPVAEPVGVVDGSSGIQSRSFMSPDSAGSQEVPTVRLPTIQEVLSPKDKKGARTIKSASLGGKNLSSKTEHHSTVTGETPKKGNPKADGKEKDKRDPHPTTQTQNSNTCPTPLTKKYQPPKPTIIGPAGPDGPLPVGWEDAPSNARPIIRDFAYSQSEIPVSPFSSTKNRDSIFNNSKLTQREQERRRHGPRRSRRIPSPPLHPQSQEFLTTVIYQSPESWLRDHRNDHVPQNAATHTPRKQKGQQGQSKTPSDPFQDQPGSVHGSVPSYTVPLLKRSNKKLRRKVSRNPGLAMEDDVFGSTAEGSPLDRNLRSKTSEPRERKWKQRQGSITSPSVKKLLGKATEASSPMPGSSHSRHGADVFYGPKNGQDKSGSVHNKKFSDQKTATPRTPESVRRRARDNLQQIRQGARSFLAQATMPTLSSKDGHRPTTTLTESRPKFNAWAKGPPKFANPAPSGPPPKAQPAQGKGSGGVPDGQATTSQPPNQGTSRPPQVPQPHMPPSSRPARGRATWSGLAGRENARKGKNHQGPKPGDGRKGD
ncbi:uncharacterized protein GGS25DRAFT_395928 [Hypoxylon fragiforme]|uniref:uncharacterized protein n=1 Tax=Hypoxylon fragiforme TaxID=63214 RepID=UPI0020C6B3D4|nr:uncharacterized protein GGS25DRAFT_395928 [Hypoxylon fragiforme]KAI2604732.1 hypothetical protein GGS25DRAFT_395928 [Hypoxylon fragiforme]